MKAMTGNGKRIQSAKCGTWNFICQALGGRHGENGSGASGSAVSAFLGLIYICMVGWLDLVGSSGLDLHFLYLLGCALVGWRAGAGVALVGALISGAFMWRDEVRAAHGAVTGWFFFWNLLLRVSGLAAIGWLAGAAGSRTRRLDSIVQRRTSSLQMEVNMHRETAARWHEMAQLFRQLTENITEVFWVSDPARSRFHYLSPGFERIWMQPCKDAYVDADGWLGGVHVGDRERVANAVKACRVSGGYDEEYRVARHDGTVRWVHDRAFPVRDEKRQLYRLAGITEDITERRRQEELRIRLEGQILEISDREQARIGQDIHDGLCQQLVGAAFAANSLERSLATVESPEVAKANRISRLLDEAITESRRVARGLYPVRLSTKGLAPALEELAASTSSKSNIRCAFQTEGSEVNCATTTATHLYRIAQEAVNNATKHSQGNKITIRLAAADGGIQLEVSDDGKGIPEMPEHDTGMGLHIMNYRARSIGAELRIVGGNTGTLVSCRVPSDGVDSVET